MKKYIQSGRNEKYPKIIETWRYGEAVPEWISDICKIKFIDALGNITLEYRNTTSGGMEFINASGKGIAFVIKNKEDYVCWGDNRLFTLRPIQLFLLYKENK